MGRDPEIQKDPLDLRLFLETIGDCVVVVDDEEIIKTHVHTENPGDALQYALQYGQLLTVKIENMKEQHRKAAEENEAQKAAAAALEPQPERAALERQEPTEEMGFISVAAGDGLKSLFLDLGCANVVSGGQTMNPSFTEDLLEAVLATPAKKVFVLPNNKNIIMAAEQTVPLATDREVIVIPTRTIPQGLSAMLAYDPDADADANKETMLEAAGNVDTGLVTFAARDSEYGGHTIRHGDILGLKNGKLEYIERPRFRLCAGDPVPGDQADLLCDADLRRGNHPGAGRGRQAPLGGKASQRRRDHSGQRRPACLLLHHQRGVVRARTERFAPWSGELTLALHRKVKARAHR